MVKNIVTNKAWLIVILLAVHIFTRFYQLEERLNFNWDQVDNAWAAKEILIDHKYPLTGMVAKQNTGFNIGPAYYYFASLFYWLTNLDPIASGYIAGVTSIITFFVLFFIVKRLFSFQVALFALFIHTFSSYIIESDRSQWPVNFVVPVSLLLFFSLYQILLGRANYFLLLGTILGLSFHLHFTSVFYPVIILLVLPLIPWSKKMLTYAVISFFLFLIWIVPIALSEFQTQGEQYANVTSYIAQNYHGFHLRRVLQIAGDAFIEFSLILKYPFVEWLKYIFVPLFCLIYLVRKHTRKEYTLCYLAALWFIVPWLLFATYSGELTNYYFFMTRPVALLVIGYLLHRFISTHYAFKIPVFLLLVHFAYVNFGQFIHQGNSLYGQRRETIRTRALNSDEVKWQRGVPESYFYYIEKRKLDEK